MRSSSFLLDGKNRRCFWPKLFWILVHFLTLCRNKFQSRGIWSSKIKSRIESNQMIHMYWHLVLPCNYTTKSHRSQFEVRPFLPHLPKAQGTTNHHLLATPPTHLRLSGTRVPEKGLTHHENGTRRQKITMGMWAAQGKQKPHVDIYIIYIYICIYKLFFRL